MEGGRELRVWCRSPLACAFSVTPPNHCFSLFTTTFRHFSMLPVTSRRPHGCLLPFSAASRYSSPSFVVSRCLSLLLAVPSCLPLFPSTPRCSARLPLPLMASSYLSLSPTVFRYF